MNRKQAFTLVELLVVIAVIAILAAILFPVFAKVRERAKAASCISNEKQIGLAIIQYSEDADEALPPRQNGSPNPFGLAGAGNNWKTEIYPYVKSRDVYACPSNGYSLQNDFDNTTIPPSYAANQQVNDPTAIPNVAIDRPFIDVELTPQDNASVSATTNSVTLSALSSPSQTIGILEVNNGPSNYDVVCDAFSNVYNLGWDLGLFHGTTTNYLFLDGHVKALSPMQTLDAADGGSNGSVNLWTNDNASFVSQEPALASTEGGSYSPCGGYMAPASVLQAAIVYANTQ